MALPEGTALHIRNYKGFGEAGAQLDSILPVNIIVGRNNSGKSALIDAVQLACGSAPISPDNYHRGAKAELLIKYAPSEEYLKKLFNPGSSGGTIASGNHWNDLGSQLVGARITAAKNGPILHYKGGHGELDRLAEVTKVEVRRVFQAAFAVEDTPFVQSVFRRVNAERNIKPEGLFPAGGGDSPPAILGDGTGITQAIAFVLQKARQPSDLVDIEMVNDVNKILGADGQFKAITIQEVQDGLWEVYLVENSGIRVALRDTGSGLKTILQVVANFVLIPHFEKKPLSAFVFGFEELENNLHPALQRRLFSYVRDRVLADKCTVFMTMHSSAVIDLFSSKPDCALVHVFKKGVTSEARRFSSYVDNKNVLDDLDVRASDLLQANALVWLEGPSDRIYFNHWIGLWSGGTLQEGAHYQCVYYGGKLLSHVSGEAPEDVASELIAALRINRNAILMMDSDIKAAGGNINDTKKRVKAEFDASDALAWVTFGREVENYLPERIVTNFVGRPAPPLGRFQALGEYLDVAMGNGSGEKFRRDKVGFAREAIVGMTREDLKDVADLPAFLDACLSKLRVWNQLGA